MYPYSDPTATGFLKRQKALPEFRVRIHQEYVRYARLPGSAFTLLDAFTTLAGDTPPVVSSVSWLAFPATARATYDEIDARRLELQDEYVEWRTERRGNKVTRVTFTTEFAEYYEALAAVSAETLVAGVRHAIAGARPTLKELFGPGFNPARATAEGRARQFREQSARNPWNDGTKGILFLTHPNSSLHALFELVGPCAVARANVPANAVCGMVACVPGRNSDPRVCEAAQNLARAGNVLSLQDPVGVRIVELQGIWKINGELVDINDPAQNRGAWTITRNGRRAQLDVTKGVTLGDEPITSGAQIATALSVSAEVISAPGAAVPAWAKTGQESSRVIT